MDYSFETSANEQSFNDALDCLSMGGTCGFVTIPNSGKKFPFSPRIMLMHATSLRGIVQGSSIPGTFLPKLIELNKEGNFPFDRIVKTYDFEEINKAFEDSRTGRAIKPVLKIS